MYLSQLWLNLHSREARKDIAQPYEMHRTLMQAFPNGLQQGQERILYRLETETANHNPTLLVQSKLPPNWTQLPAGYLLNQTNKPTAQVKQFTLELQQGQLLAFRLLANPTKRLSTKVPRKNTDKPPISKRIALHTSVEQLEWLNRKAQAHGFQIVTAIPNRQTEIHDQPHALTLLGVQFDGLLHVNDPEQLHNAVINGIGSGKAFGCGLLSLAPTH